MFYLLINNLYIYNLYDKNGIQKEFSRRVLLKRRHAADMLHIYSGIPIQTCGFSKLELILLHGRSPENWLKVEHFS